MTLLSLSRILLWLSRLLFSDLQAFWGMYRIHD